jgi:hypothetical protein
MAVIQSGYPGTTAASGISYRIQFVSSDGTTQTTGSGNWPTWTNCWTSSGTNSTNICPGDEWIQTTFNNNQCTVSWNEWPTQRQQEREMGQVGTPAVARQVNRNARWSPERKARALLLRNLTREQRHELDKLGHFHVISREGVRYRIHDGTLAINVEQLDGEGKLLRKLCAHPVGVPLGDGLLAQKLQLEFAEDDFLRVANVHFGPPLRQRA